jgi:hypothetical protein
MGTSFDSGISMRFVGKWLDGLTFLKRQNWKPAAELLENHDAGGSN